MKKKLIGLLSIICLCLLTGCSNKNDHIELYNKESWVFDNIHIDAKEGYFYNRYEKFIVDENTIGITVYFSNKEDTWEDR